MTKVTELAIRAKAAVQYPGWRVDFVGPATAVMTNIMGHRRMAVSYTHLDVYKRQIRGHGKEGAINVDL